MKPSSVLSTLRVLATAAISAGVGLLAPAAAQDATWLSNPGSSDLGTATNWNTGAVPTGTAFFGSSATTTLTFSAVSSVGGWTFAGGAPAYTLVTSHSVPSYSFTGAGIVNGANAIIENVNLLYFQNASTAGAVTINNTGGFVQFLDNSTAGSATINNLVSSASALFFLNNSSAGNSTLVNAGNILVWNNSTLGNASVTNDAGALLRFVGFSTGGNASIVNNAGGVVDFSASDGPGHDSKLSVGSLSGAGGFSLGANQLTVGGNNASTTVSGAISDCTSCAVSGATGGSLRKTGTGTLTLSGANSYTGGSVVTAGQLTLGSVTALGNTSNTTAISGGTLDLGGFTVTQNGGLTLNGGTLQNGTFGTIGGFNLQAGTVNATLGSGSVLAKTTAGVVILGAANTYTGGSTISAGTLQLGNAGALGNNANTTAISGGTIDLGGFTAAQALLSQSGGTVQNGTMNVGTYQLTGGTLASTATVSAATAFDLQAGTINGVLAGAGALTKTTAGLVTMSDTNTYTGATTVNGGTLSVNGSIATSITTVNAGGTLGGNGTVGTTTINGGALAPGNSVGTLNVSGNLVFTSAARYLVEVSAAGADRVNVTGTATLGGATVNVSFVAGSYVSKQFTIVNATGGVIGTFGAQADTNLPAGFRSSLSYDANDVFINLDLTLAQYTGLNVNQQNVGTSLVNYFNRTGGIPLVFGTLTPVGLTQASGEIATATQQATFDAMNLFLGVLTDPFTAGREAGQGMVSGYTGESLSYAAKRGAGDALDAIYRKAPLTPRFAEHWNLWAAGFGGQRTTDGNATLGSSNATARIGGEKTHDSYPGLVYTNLSIVGSTELSEELKLLGARYTNGVVVTQVVPAVDGYSSAILEYKAALAKYFPGEAPDYVSLEGYIGANIMIQALRQIGPQLDTEKLVDSLESLRGVDMGLGTSLSFGRSDHQASHKVWGTALDESGKYQAIDLE